MKNFLTAVLCLALLAGCRASDVGQFWNTHSIDYADIHAAEEQFADFAELAAKAPEQDALAALDGLFDKLKQDTVAYYLYSEWMDGAFYNLLSPCRNPVLYGKAVDRIAADGILTPNECEPFLRRREWVRYNQEGAMAVVPGWTSDGTRSLVLVLDLGCPTCREALETLSADPQWSGIRKTAVCLGYGAEPAVPGWDYLFPENASEVFDIHMTPVYFVTAADGTVERGYTLVL